MTRARIVIVPTADDAADGAALHIAAALRAAVEARGVAHWATTGGSTAPGALPPPRRPGPSGRPLGAGRTRGGATTASCRATTRCPTSSRSTTSSWTSARSRRARPSGSPRPSAPPMRPHGRPTSTRSRTPRPSARGVGAALGRGARRRRRWPRPGSTRTTGASRVLDLVVLGLGGDGHTLSVFPGSAAFDSAGLDDGHPGPDPHRAARRAGDDGARPSSGPRATCSIVATGASQGRGHRQRPGRRRRRAPLAGPPRRPRPGDLDARRGRRRATCRGDRRRAAADPTARSRPTARCSATSGSTPGGRRSTSRRPIRTTTSGAGWPRRWPRATTCGSRPTGRRRAGRRVHRPVGDRGRPAVHRPGLDRARASVGACSTWPSASGRAGSSCGASRPTSAPAGSTSATGSSRRLLGRRREQRGAAAGHPLRLATARVTVSAPDLVVRSAGRHADRGLPIRSTRRPAAASSSTARRPTTRRSGSSARRSPTRSTCTPSTGAAAAPPGTRAVRHRARVRGRGRGRRGRGRSIAACPRSTSSGTRTAGAACSGPRSRRTPSRRVVSYEGAPAAPGTRYGDPASRRGARSARRRRAVGRSCSRRSCAASSGMSTPTSPPIGPIPVWPLRVAAAPTIARELTVEAGTDRLARPAGRRPPAGPPGPRRRQPADVRQRRPAALDARLADGRVVVIPGARHAAHHSHVPELVAALAAFLGPVGR